MEQKRKAKIIKELVSIFTPYVDGVLMEGSSAWMGLQKGHDVDLEFLVPNFDFLKIIISSKISIGELARVLKNFISHSLSFIISLNLEMFSLKVFLEGEEISLRFTKSKLFERICRLKLEKTDRTMSIFQYRLYPTLPFDFQRNFSGGKIQYFRQCFSSGQNQLIETTIAIVDKKGRFYPGGIIDRYLSFPKVLYEKNYFCQKNLKKLKFNLIKRLIMEEKKGLHFRRPSFGLCLSRYGRIPKDLVEKLEEEGKQIRSQIKG